MWVVLIDSFFWKSLLSSRIISFLCEQKCNLSAWVRNIQMTLMSNILFTYTFTITSNKIVATGIMNNPNQNTGDENKIWSIPTKTAPTSMVGHMLLEYINWWIEFLHIIWFCVTCIQGWKRTITLLNPIWNNVSTMSRN